jgi:hypothetical protein
MSNVISLARVLNDRDATETDKYEFALLRQQWERAIEREERRQYGGQHGLVGKSDKRRYDQGR